MNYRDALLQSGDDVLISLDVSPGSKKTVFPAGYNEWRNAIECRIKSPATEGKANSEIIKTIADYFSVKKKDVVIASGATSGQKKIKVSGISFEDVAGRLSRDLRE
jgi:uncharacterized protein